MNEGQKIAEAALSWLGTPHVNGAKTEATELTAACF